MQCMANFLWTLRTKSSASSRTSRLAEGGLDMAGNGKAGDKACAPSLNRPCRAGEGGNQRGIFGRLRRGLGVCRLLTVPERGTSTWHNPVPAGGEGGGLHVVGVIGALPGEEEMVTAERPQVATGGQPWRDAWNPVCPCCGGPCDRTPGTVGIRALQSIILTSGQERVLVRVAPGCV